MMPVLLPGVPLAGDTPFHKFAYYQLRAAGGNADYDIIVTVTVGGACPSISCVSE